MKFWMSNSLLKTKQEIILTKCCANNSFQTIKHCNWPIETHYFCAPSSFLREFFTKIHFRSVEKYYQPDKRQTVTEPTWSWKPYRSQLFIELPTISIRIPKITEFSMSLYTRTFLIIINLYKVCRLREKSVFRFIIIFLEI